MTYNETKVNKAISFWHFIQEHTVENTARLCPREVRRGVFAL